MVPIWLKPMEEWPQFDNLRQSVARLSGVTSVTGVSEAQKCHLASCVIYPLERPCLFITYNELQANKFYEDFKFFFPRETVLFPQREIMLYNAAAHSHEVIGQRLSVLQRILSGENLLIVASIDALLTPNMPPEDFKESLIRIKEGDECDPQELAKRVVSLGYERVETVEGSGQFSVRGGIFDIFPLTSDKPARIDFFDEFVDSVTTFDPLSQRSDDRIGEVIIPPAGELILSRDELTAGKAEMERSLKKLISSARQGPGLDADKLKSRLEQVWADIDSGIISDTLFNYFPFFCKNPSTLIGYLGSDATIIVDEPSRIREHTVNIASEFEEHFKELFLHGEVLPEQAGLLINYTDLLAEIASSKCMVVQALPRTNIGLEPKRIFQVTSRSVAGYQGKPELLADDIRYWKSKAYSVLLLSGTRQKGEGLRSVIREYGIEAVVLDGPGNEIYPGQVVIIPGTLSKGFEYVESRFAFVADSDIFGVQKRKRAVKKRAKKPLDPFTDLKVGDYVVHENHGIGRYLGIEKLTVNGVERDYLNVQYAGTDRLYIPTDQMGLIQPYIGLDDKEPRLSKLGGAEWQKAKNKARQSVKELAIDLVKLYAEREATTGFEFSKDTDWQLQFEEAFPYEETPDQLQSIAEIKNDMESKKVMDRLLCGDVGYGKTEVAIRAAFKAVMDEKQVAVLVPTTILAQQHYNTFVSRFGEFPFKIEVLSRFKTAKEQKEILKALKEGNIDVIIGTHRLLSKDVKFKDLGLLIVDEEQRFGVGHKEQIKELKKNIDVLTLTATPIPRTLHMSLVGIRDISIIETPPEERYPVQTYVVEYSDSLVRDAVLREVQRGGQVYFVYNHVKTMEKMAERLRELLPDIRIATAHGQMSETMLEKIMLAFYEREYDLLLCSTIVENGLDIPNVNTLIVYDADRFGLSQLYQLRGRVGRSNRIAYAYLTYKKDKILNEVAEKRLQAIKEFTEFGSGFKIAMKDLEIRGAGNLLGAEQHGQMAAVGYELYCKLLDETIRSLKGEYEPKAPDAVIDLRLDAFIDSSYIRQESRKIEMYKRIAAIEDLGDKYDVEEELVDRFGDIPPETQNLIYIAYTKALATKFGFSEISQQGRQVRMKLRQDKGLDPRQLMVILNENRDILRYTGTNPPVLNILLKEENGSAALQAARSILERIKDLQ